MDASGHFVPKGRMTPTLLLSVCLMIFVVGWTKFMAPSILIYFLDYAFRIVCLMILLPGHWRRIFTLPPRPWLALALTIPVLMIDLALLAGYWNLPPAAAAPFLGVADYPRLPPSGLLTFDLTVGIALVALSEEAIFRYLFTQSWAERRGSTEALYVFSSLAFGLIHLPRGIAVVVTAGVIGLLYMWLYRRTQSLWPPMIAHYVTDVVAYSDLACLFAPSACGPTG